MEKAVVAAPGAELSLHLLHLHGRGHGVVRDGRGEPAVGDAEEAEAVGLQVGAVAGQRAQQRSPGAVATPAGGAGRPGPLTRPWGPMAPWCRSSAMRPMAMHPALPTWAGALASCPSTWKVPRQLASASLGVTTSVAAGVAWVVSVVLVQPVASRHPTITTVAALQRGIHSPAHSHVRVRVNSVLWCI
jgi:hypothetical protein